MRKVLASVAVGALALSGTTLVTGAVGASSTTTTTAPPTTSTTAPTTTTLAPPVQGAANLPLYLNVDTVVGSGGTGVLKAPIGCAMTNEFYVGQTVVFRMSGVNVATGGTPLTGSNVASATITVPGIATPFTMNYGNHGTAAFWSYGWNTTGYATMGVVPFKLTVTTKSVPAVTKVVRQKIKGKWVQKRVVVKKAIKAQTFTYTQAGTSANSQLTINPVPAG